MFQVGKCGLSVSGVCRETGRYRRKQLPVARCVNGVFTLGCRAILRIIGRSRIKRHRREQKVACVTQAGALDPVLLGGDIFTLCHVSIIHIHITLQCQGEKCWSFDDS